MVLSSELVLNWKLYKESLKTSWEAQRIESMLSILAWGLLVIEGGTSTWARLATFEPLILKWRLWVVGRSSSEVSSVVQATDCIQVKGMGETNEDLRTLKRRVWKLGGTSRVLKWELWIIGGVS